MNSGPSHPGSRVRTGRSQAFMSDNAGPKEGGSNCAWTSRQWDFTEEKPVETQPPGKGGGKDSFGRANSTSNVWWQVMARSGMR